MQLKIFNVKNSDCTTRIVVKFRGKLFKNSENLGIRYATRSTPESCRLQYRDYFR
jgi:hypothetical protein